MPDDITFTDLVAIIKIKPDTTVEKYGGLINSSLFDAANVLGTLSQKKLISFTTAMPGQNPIMLTEAGKNLIAEADTKAEGEFDHLDLTILQQLQKGTNAPADIAKAINISPRDLAMHLYKLSKQGYSTYEFRSGIINMMLTEKGFAQAKAGMPVKQAPAQQQAAPTPFATGSPVVQFKVPPMQSEQAQPQSQPQPAAPQQLQQQQVQAQAEAAAIGQPQPEPPRELTPEQIETQIKAKAKKSMMIKVGVVIVVVIIGIVALYLTGRL